MSPIDDLLTLYRIDAQVRGLRTRLDNAEQYLRIQTRLHEELLLRQEELDTRKKHLQATIANLEGEAEVFDQRIEKLRDELNSASTNKQYSAVLTEMNTIKLNKSDVEDRAVQEMETVEQLEEQRTSLQGQIVERAGVRDVAVGDLEQRKADIGQRLSELETEREQAAAIIPPTNLAIFDEVADLCDGEAMSPIEEINRRRREYACGSCNMQAQYESVALLMGGSNTLVRCSACGRILYLQEETREVLAKK